MNELNVLPVQPGAINAGAVAIEQERAIAEAQGQLILAKRFPRDLNAAHAELMTACKSPAFAAVAFYTVPNRGSGPSIRFAEEVARVFGNFQYGHRELSRDSKKSEVEVYAWDMEKNNRSTRQLTVMHVQDTKYGPKDLRDQADIDNKIANVASKQVRGRILALLPKWLIEDAIQECKKTLAGNNDEPVSVRVRKMAQAFARFGVTTELIERYLKTKLDDVMIDQLADMMGVYNAIKEGAKPSDYFESAVTGNSALETLTHPQIAAPAAGPTQQVEQVEQQGAPARRGRPPKTDQSAQAPEPEHPPAHTDDDAPQQPDGEDGDMF